MWTDPLPLIVIGVTAAVLAWDVTLAGWIAARREAPRLFTQLTAFCGLLVVPALVVSSAAATESGARTIAGITWLQVVVAAAFVLQVSYAVGIRLVSPVVGIPILLYDVMLAFIAIGDYLVAQNGTAPVALQAAVSARDVIVGLGVGRAALVSPLTTLAPIVAPAYPARWRLSGLARASLVLTSVALTTLLTIELPRGVAAVQSYDVAVGVPLAARPRGDFRIGLRFLPVLNTVPPQRTVRADTMLFKAFNPDIALVVLGEEGTTNAALDSLARVMERWRVDRNTGDTLLLAVGLRVGRQILLASEPSRVNAVRRVLERLRPDIIFPALPDPLPSWLERTPPSAAWWRATLLLTAQEVRRVRPQTLVGWSAARLDAADSAVYAWAAGPGSPVDVLGAAVFPSFSGLPAVDARLRAFERWHSQAAAAQGAKQLHWLTTVGGLPHTHGDAAQEAAIRRALVWGTQRDWITAVIVGEPADYEGWTGLRAANGRYRLAVSTLGLESRRMREVRR